MEIDESILKLAAKLDGWLDGFFPMLDTNDMAAQSKALIGGIEMVKEFDRLKADGLAAVAAFVESASKHQRGMGRISYSRFCIER